MESFCLGEALMDRAQRNGLSGVFNDAPLFAQMIPSRDRIGVYPKRMHQSLNRCLMMARFAG